MSNNLISATFVRKTNKFDLKFANGLELTFLANKIESLKGLDHSEIEAISLINKGTVLKWSGLGLEIPVHKLCETLLRGETWSHSGNS